MCQHDFRVTLCRLWQRLHIGRLIAASRNDSFSYPGSRIVNLDVITCVKSINVFAVS